MNQTTRREFLKEAALAGAAISTSAPHSLLATSALPESPTIPRNVALSLLGNQPPAMPTGISWGVPFPQGAVRPNVSFSLSAQSGSLPLQSWPLAFWPDGSLKWSGFAAVAPAGLAGPLTLALGADQSADSTATAISTEVMVKNDGKSILVNTSALQCSIPLSGPDLVRSITLGGKPIAGAGQLVCILQNGAANNPEDSPAREKFLSDVKHVTVEQSGPVRAVVKIEGMHRGTTSKREWLPFTVRLYFYGGQTSIRVVHTIVFDGDQEKDFVRGLGLQIDVPMRDEPRNRTVRFAGPDGGLWSEPLQPGGGSPVQESGQPFAGNPVFGQNAIWDDFKLVQPNPDGFTIVKRIGLESTWLYPLSPVHARPVLPTPAISAAASRSASRTSGSRSLPRSRFRTPPVPRPNSSHGCGRPTRQRWTCASTIPTATDSTLPTKTRSQV